MSNNHPPSRQHVRDIAEIEVRRYFDHYLMNVLPQREEELRDYTRQSIKKHDHDRDAHGGVERKVDRAKWMLSGVSLIVGGVGGWLVRVLPFFS